MSTSNDLINAFEPVSLETMDGVKLLDRMDSKYVFRVEDLPPVMEKLVNEYLILEIGQTRIQRYETLYFDTPEYLLYLNHHNKRLNRFKVRCRKYLDTDQHYFEIKFKNNKGRTYKERCKQQGAQDQITGKSGQLLAEHTPLTPAMLLPALWVTFARITLVNRGMSERVTIDTDLAFRDGSGACGYPGIAIAEIKQERSKQSIMAGTLHAAHINGTRISKYCIGMASLKVKIKHNNFKKKLHLINKLNHDLR